MREPKFTANGPNGQRQLFRSFLGRHASEEMHLNDLDLQWIGLFETLQRFVHDQQRLVDFRCAIWQYRDRDFFRSAPLFGRSLARRIDQNLAHQPGSDSVEVQPVFIRRMPAPGEPQKGFMHQRGGLEVELICLAAQMRPGQVLQVVINQRDDVVHRIAVAFLQTLQKLCDLHLEKTPPLNTARALRGFRRERRNCCPAKPSYSRDSLAALSSLPTKLLLGSLSSQSRHNCSLRQAITHASSRRPARRSRPAAAAYRWDSLTASVKLVCGLGADAHTLRTSSS